MKKILLVLSALIFISCGKGPAGKSGLPGTNGKNGVDGQDGKSLVTKVTEFTSNLGAKCSQVDIFLDVDNNYTFSDEDVYQNGFITCDGLDSELESGIVELIDPCGKQKSNGTDEVILKLSNGTYLASYSDNIAGLNTRLVSLIPGNYITSDGTNCHFTLE